MDMNSENVCCLCGLKKADITKEHVFPKGIFNTPRPTNLPQRIPACFECNNGLSKDEDDFRVFLTAGTAYESNAGKQMWTEKIRPALKRRLKQRIRHMVKQSRIMDKSGNVVGHLPILEVERESVNRVLKKIAKGLYYLDTQRVLAGEVEIHVGYYEENPDIFPPLDEAIKGAKRVDLGQGEVTYWRNTIKDNFEESLTRIQFYEDKIFLICTTRQSSALR